VRLAKRQAVLLAVCFALQAMLPATLATAAPDSCTGVWVVVDPGDSGGEPVAVCATAHQSGTAALESAGFVIGRSDSMLCQINAQPADCVVKSTAYWSYWHADPTDTGYADWAYSSKGPDSYQPAPGAAEGWRFGDGTAPPRLKPPSLASPAPSTPTSSDPVPQPPVTPQPTADAGSPLGLIAGGAILAGIVIALVIWRARR
jgi:hypothetical protein